jgi:hypothetical protein
MAAGVITMAHISTLWIVLQNVCQPEQEIIYLDVGLIDTIIFRAKTRQYSGIPWRGPSKRDCDYFYLSFYDRITIKLRTIDYEGSNNEIQNSLYVLLPFYLLFSFILCL